MPTERGTNRSGAGLRWTIKPEALMAPNGAEITMGVAYGPALDEAIEVVPASELAAVIDARDEQRWDAERQVDVMREAVARLRPLARRAITESGESGDQARRDIYTAIEWIRQGCPPSTEDGIDDA